MSNSDSTATEQTDSPIPSIQLEGIHIKVAGKDLIKPVTLEIPKEKLTVIVGVSGAGKSLLLNLLAGLLDDTDADIQWDGCIRDSNREQLKNVGIVFQHFALFDDFSSLTNVRFAIDHRIGHSAASENSSSQWLEELGVPSQTPVASLSGGQKQRLAIARTLAAGPEMILYDEPTSGLDAVNGRRVTELIQRMQQEHACTSIVVTHDYRTLLPIADKVLLLDRSTRQLVPLPEDQWDEIEQLVDRSATATDPADLTETRGAGLLERFLGGTGAAVAATLLLPLQLLCRPPVTRWPFRFCLHYLKLIGGVSALAYLVVAGIIIGFSTTFFTFRYLPFSLYTKPLLIEDLLGSIGFALYRIIVPVMATIMIAARCGAAIAADVGVKKYGAQVDALKTFRCRPQDYLLSPITYAFLIATPILEWFSFQAAKWTSMFTFLWMHPNVNAFFWEIHFNSQLASHRAISEGALWVALKNALAGVGIATIAYYRGIRKKNSTQDVTGSITSTVLWATIYVLLVHFIIALFEF